MAERIVNDSTIHRIDVNFACEKSDLDEPKLDLIRGRSESWELKSMYLR